MPPCLLQQVTFDRHLPCYRPPVRPAWGEDSTAVRPYLRHMAVMLALSGLQLVQAVARCTA